MSEVNAGWTQCALGDVVQLIRGVSYTKDQASGEPGTKKVPILRATNIDQHLDFDDLVYVPKERVSTEQLLKKGDIVIAASSGSKSIVGKAGQLMVDWHGSFGAFCMGLRPNDAVEPKYVGYFLQSREYRSAVSKLSAGSNINNLKREHIHTLPFQLAPKSIQSDIVRKIEELFSDLDAGVAALKRAQANLKRYRAAVLKAAVEGRLTAQWRAERKAKGIATEPAAKLLERILAERRKKWEAAQLKKYADAGKVPPKGWQSKYQEPVVLDTNDIPELPDGWNWCSLDQASWLVKNGLSQKPSVEPIGFPILRINAVRPMSVDESEVRFLDISEKEAVDYVLEDGDLLFTRYNGSVDLLGVAGLVRGITQKLLHPDKLIRVKAVMLDDMPKYMELACNCGESRRHIVSKARTTAGQTGVSGGDIKAIPIPLCSLAEQTEIVSQVEAKVSNIAQAETEIKRSLERAARLRQAILKRAFEGRLV